MSIRHSRRIIEEIIKANPIVNLVSGLFPMEAICTKDPYSKYRVKGNCPFHKDDKKQFHVFDGPRGTGYICHGCGRSGDVVTFTMEYEGLTFTEALQALADRGNVGTNPLDAMAYEDLYKTSN